MRSRRGTFLAVGIALAALVVAIPLGSWERSHAVESQLAGIQRVRSLVGDDLFGSSLRGRAAVGKLECLLYRSGGYDYALELCFDYPGRLVRAIDASGPADPGLWDLTSDPSRAPLRLSAADRTRAADALLMRARVGMATRGAYDRAISCATAISLTYGAKAVTLTPERLRRAGQEAVEVCNSSVSVIHAIRLQSAVWRLPALDAGLLAFEAVAAGQPAIANQAAAEVAAGAGVSAATKARATAALAAVQRSWAALAKVRAAVGLTA